MISRQDSMNLAPANWFIISNDGTNITATNKITGQSFSGTLASFYSLINAPAEAEFPTYGYSIKSELAKVGNSTTLWAGGMLFWMPPGDGATTGMQFVGDGTGSFTLSAAGATSLTVTGGWVYLTANAGGSGNTAGWRYFTMSDDTHGKIYTATYDSTLGIPPIVPASLIEMAFVSNSRLTSSTADIQIIQIPIDFSKQMGLNGCIKMWFRTFGNGTGNNKYCSLRAGVSTLHQNIPVASTVQDSIFAVSNCGSLSRQLVTRQSQSIAAAVNSTISNDFRSVNLAAETSLNVGIKNTINVDSFMIAVRDLSITYGA